jgi:hypothetical protein
MKSIKNALILARFFMSNVLFIVYTNLIKFLPTQSYIAGAHSPE